MVALLGAMAYMVASAESLPAWAVGTFTGMLVNWCEVYDDPSDIGPWYSSLAKLTVEQDGKIKGEVRFGALKGTPQGTYSITSSTEDSIVLSLKWHWYEKGDVDETSLIELILRKTSSGSEMEYVDKEVLESKSKNPYENCPVAGTLTKSGSGSDVPAEWKKARTLMGVATRAMPPPYNVQGLFELKCGKANKKGIAKVSATLTGLDGKKTSYKAQSVDVTGKTATVNFNGMSVTIDGESFNGGEGLPGGLSVQSADVGGNWTRTDAKVCVDTTVVTFPAGTVAELLPVGEPVIAKGGKWAFNKAATVKFVTMDGDVEWDTSNGKTNLSSMKLTYTPKTGFFKGSFKVYALEGAKLRKYTANVSGFVVDGTGYGQATIKKPAAGPWTVTVE